MKREILFKAKRVENGEWVEGKSLIQGEIEGREFTQIEHSYFDNYRQYEVNADTVCQFTGLSDKNGNKIFEGDLCKDQFNRVMKIITHNFRLKFECVSGGDSDHWKYADFIDWCKFQGAEITNKCRVEIIGNIHD